jgi:hypothetical protein
MTLTGDQIKTGDEYLGNTVAVVFGQSTSAVVYTTTNNELRWSYLANDGHVPLNLQTAVSQFDSLMADIAVYIPKRQQIVAYAALGKALFTAFDGGDPTQVDGAFKPIRDLIATISLQRARYEYLLAFLLSAVVLASPIFFGARVALPGSTLAWLLWAAAAGIAGAAMSVLYRSHALNLDPKAGRPFIQLQGACRPLLGALFGGFIVLACRGDLIFAFANDHPLALIPLAVVAGFSERLVPEIMSHLEGTP